MRAILIDTYNKSVSEVDTVGDLQSIYELVRTDIIEAVYLPGRNAMFVDEEGLYRQPPKPVFQFLGFDQPMVGNGLILGFDEDGDNCDTTVSLAGVIQRVVWRDHLEFAGMRPFSGTGTLFGEPAVVIGAKAEFKPKEDK